MRPEGPKSSALVGEQEPTREGPNTRKSVNVRYASWYVDISDDFARRQIERGDIQRVRLERLCEAYDVERRAMGIWIDVDTNDERTVNVTSGRDCMCIFPLTPGPQTSAAIWFLLYWNICIGRCLHFRAHPQHGRASTRYPVRVGRDFALYGVM